MVPTHGQEEIDAMVVRSEPISIETVSKELLIQALKEVDIPREKKVFIWNRLIREVQRQAMVMLQVPSGKQSPATQ